MSSQRTPTQLTDAATKTSPNHFNRQVGMYSLAAAVAGVSLLALAQPAAGEVVITRKTIPIPDPSNHDPLMISLANNGIDNFGFTNDASIKEGGSLLVFGASPRDKELAAGDFYAEAVALPRGARIGSPVPPSSAGFVSTALIEGSEESPNGVYRTLRGYWGGNPKNRYLGVKFAINGQTHYGWVRLTVTTNPEPNEPPISATITAYAYETVANKPIAAGTAAGTADKPTAEIQLPGNIIPQNLQSQSRPSLGMLALGADGVPLWRREETLIPR